MGPDATELLLAKISNACWWVRHCTRNARLHWKDDPARREAIAALALALLVALQTSSEYDTILTTLVDGLRPRDTDPPF